MDNNRIINELIALEAMAATMLEKCQQMRKQIAPDPKKKRKKSGLSEAEILRMKQHAKAVWIRRGLRNAEKLRQEQEAAKSSNKTGNNL